MVNNGEVEPDAKPPADPVATGAPTATAAAPVTLGKREGRSPRDMILSLLVLLVPIVLVLTFYRVVLGGEDPITADPEPTLRQARAAAVFPVLVPTGLGDDWHLINASWRSAADGATLRFGYVAPDDDAALLIESSVPPEELLPAELGDETEPRGTFRDGGRAWRGYAARAGETALVNTEQGRTVVIVGNTDMENLRALAGSLR
jgi:hypothetical protein